MSTLLLIIKILAVIYIIVTILTTLCAFSVINETGLILNEIRREVYENSQLKNFCESPISGQICRSFTMVGWYPILNLCFLLNFIVNKEDLVLRLAYEYIREYENKE